MLSYMETSLLFSRAVCACVCVCVLAVIGALIVELLSFWGSTFAVVVCSCIVVTVVVGGVKHTERTQATRARYHLPEKLFGAIISHRQISAIFRQFAFIDGRLFCLHSCYQLKTIFFFCFGPKIMNFWQSRGAMAGGFLDDEMSDDDE